MIDTVSIESPNDFVIRRADASDSAALAAIDSTAAAGDMQRVAKIQDWCQQGSTLMAERPSGPLGYIVVEYTFFDQGFVSMLMVAPHARRRGIGAQLLEAAAATCTTEKLFTSTNVSNHSMQSVLLRVGWQAVGIVHGLDENDPELFFHRA